MNAITLMVGKEIRDGLRNRWVLAITVLMAALALALGFLGSAPTGTVKVDATTVTVVSLSSLSVFLVPLIALLLAYDAIVGEIDRGTMALLLSYPVSRGQVMLGKFIGHLAVLTLATVLGYGSAGLLLQLMRGSVDLAGLVPFGRLIAASICLGASFLAMGYLISTLVRERATAAGIAIGVWLFFVVIYDMGLLGVLVADQGRTVTAAMLDVALLLNPADVYRLLNLSGVENTAMYAGVTGLQGQSALSGSMLIAAQGLWVAVPFALAAICFGRRQL